jgi:hypothetical protein
MASWDSPVVNAPTTANYAPPVQDFSGIANLLQDWVKGKQMGREEEKATLFRNGIPKVGGSTDPNAPIDVGAVTDKLARINPDYAMPLINTQIAGQQGQTAANAIMAGQPTPAGGPAPQRAPVAQPSASAPSGPAAAPAQTAQPTVMSILSAQGIPNDQLQAASESVARQLGVAPNAPIDTQDPQVRNVLGPAIAQLKKGGIGNVVMASAAPTSSATASGVPQSAPQEGTPQLTPNQRVAQAGVPQVTAQPQSDASPGWSQADADALSARATRLRAYGAAIANVNPKASEMAKSEAEATDARAKQIRDYLSEEDKSTPDMKNFNSDHLPGETMAGYQARVGGGVELAKQDSIAYSKKYEGIQKAATEASIEQPKIQLAKTLINSPNFYSGPLEPTNRAYKQFAATIGADPNKALPQEGFNKIVSDMLTSQIRALGASGAGPVRIAEVKNMQKSIANLGITPVTNRLLVEITDRTYRDVQEIARITREYESNPGNRPGKMNVGLDQAIHDYYVKHPLFNEAEMKDPRLIAPPEFPTAREAFNAHLPKGQPVKIDGKLKWAQ